MTTQCTNRVHHLAMLVFLLLASILIPFVVASFIKDGAPDLSRMVGDLAVSNGFEIIYASEVKCSDDRLAAIAGSGVSYPDWYRCVVLERKAFISGAPTSTVTEFGRIDYGYEQGGYRFRKWHSVKKLYNGLYAPESRDLVQYLRKNIGEWWPKDERSDSVADVIEPMNNDRWLWHDAESFSVPIRVCFRGARDDSDTAMVQQLINVRFYRESVNGPLNKLRVVSRSTQGGCRMASQQHTAEIDLLGI